MKALVAAFVAGGILVQSTSAIAGRAEELELLSESPTLTPQENAGVDIATQWDDASGSVIMPDAGESGEIRYVYGAQRPSIVCSPIHVCDIELQRGEAINGVPQVGDIKRWEITPITTGRGKGEVVHIFVKPHDAGLETNLIVATDLRIYHFRLRSHATKYMPRVVFTYPEEALSKWEELRVRQQREREEKTIPETGAYLGELSFDYTVDGVARWKPIRVYNDGKKTIIQMPNSISQSKLPTLYLLQKEAGIFTDEKLEIVNARFLGNRFIVDNVFDKAILVLGTGDERERITITRGSEE